jgi:hypothetical protein
MSVLNSATDLVTEATEREPESAEEDFGIWPQNTGRANTAAALSPTQTSPPFGQFLTRPY